MGRKMIDDKYKEFFVSKKIIGYDEAKRRISIIKESGFSVGLCHGGFDLLHPGHIRHFESAKKFCDYLFVSVNTDRFVAMRKGDGRPVYPDWLRAYMIASIRFVDFVVISDYKRGVEVINYLKPSFYIKGPDFVNKSTPGIISEREAIGNVGGEMRYTSDPNMSITSLVHYIKGLPSRKRLLLVLDRDGTIIEERGFLGKNPGWKDEIRLKKDVVDFIISLQAKYDVTSVVVSNQGGVARGYFDTDRVDEINKYINNLLKEKGVKISNWQHCPYVDWIYAENNKDKIIFNPDYVKVDTKRKPNPEMVFDSLKELKLSIDGFDKRIVVGDKGEDKKLASNIDALFFHSDEVKA